MKKSKPPSQNNPMQAKYQKNKTLFQAVDRE